MSSFKEPSMHLHQAGQGQQTPTATSGGGGGSGEGRVRLQSGGSTTSLASNSSKLASSSQMDAEKDALAAAVAAAASQVVADRLNLSMNINAAADTTTDTTASNTSPGNPMAPLTDEERELLDRMTCVDDFEHFAKGRMSKMVYDYYCGGSDNELTLRWNRSMISERYNLRPRVMCDVSRLDTTKYLYGDRLSMPIGISPTAMHKMAHPGGELATVRACKRANALMILSLFSTTSLEDVARQEPICTKWQNLYILKNRDTTQNIVTRAIRNAYRAIVVTCDAPILGNRRHDKRNQLSLANYPLENLQETSTKNVKEHSSSIFDPSVTWADLAELKKQVGDTVRVIAKGIMTPEDAEQALAAGVDGVYVSNHGGRQLDGCQSTIEALPAIVRAVNKRCPVLVDGGFRTGADILKALALGADMVFVGRAPLMGLASFGEEGVYAVLSMLHDELKRAMMLTGCNKLSDINSNIILERQ